MIIFKIKVNFYSFAFIYGFFLILLTSIFVQIMIATLCLRFRDFVQIVQSLLFLTFIMTPIFWKPEILQGRRYFIVEYNLLYHYIETIRRPILFQQVNWNSLIIASSATVVIGIVSIIVFYKTKNKLVYWK